MADQQQPYNDSANVPNRSTAVMIMATIADTTWRLFVPVFVFMGAGLYVDHARHQKPLLAMTGTIAGAVVGFLLVRQQYKRIVAGEKHK